MIYGEEAAEASKKPMYQSNKTMTLGTNLFNRHKKQFSNNNKYHLNLEIFQTSKSSFIKVTYFVLETLIPQSHRQS